MVGCQQELDTIQFEEGDSDRLGTKITEALDHFVELEAEDFKTFERFCSGSSLSGGFDAARQWAIDHLGDLHSQAQASEDEGYGYSLPMGYCTFAANELAVVYETTSGTILLVTAEGQYGVFVPLERNGGFHSTILRMVKAHASVGEVDRFVNPHNYAND